MYGRNYISLFSEIFDSEYFSQCHILVDTWAFVFQQFVLNRTRLKELHNEGCEEDDVSYPLSILYVEALCDVIVGREERRGSYVWGQVVWSRGWRQGVWFFTCVGVGRGFSPLPGRVSIWWRFGDPVGASPCFLVLFATGFLLYFPLFFLSFSLCYVRVLLIQSRRSRGISLFRAGAGIVPAASGDWASCQWALGVFSVMLLFCWGGFTHVGRSGIFVDVYTIFFLSTVKFCYTKYFVDGRSLYE